MPTSVISESGIQAQYRSHPICRPQDWVVNLVEGGPEKDEAAPPGVEIIQRSGADLSLITARLEDTRSLDGDSLSHRVEQIYSAILTLARERHLVRIWNLVPGILEPLDDFHHRYLAFNSGRFTAYLKAYGGSHALDYRVATATGVGFEGDDLMVHALASEHPGVPFENPRQVSSYRYSERYGTKPPCFSRGTLLEGTTSRPPMLLVGGTASIVGESSLHIGDLDRQLRETFANLASVVGAAPTREFIDSKEAVSEDTALSWYRYLRVYLRPGQAEEAVRDRVRAAFPNLSAFEVFQADLCRDNLLVEIEGWAEP